MPIGATAPKRGEDWFSQRSKAGIDKALEEYDEAIRHDPGNCTAYYERGMVWHRGKLDDDKAIRDFDQAIRLNPTVSKYFQRRGSAWSFKREYQRALKDYEEAIRLDPTDAYNYSYRAGVWKDLNEFDKAIKDLDEAIRCLNGQKETNPYIEKLTVALRADLHDDLADVWLKKRDYNRAIQEYEESIKISPTSQANDDLAWLLATCPKAEVRDGKRAIGLATMSCENSKWDWARPLQTLAAAYAEVGQFEEAVRYQQRALELKIGLFWRGGETVAKQRLELYKKRNPYRETP